MSKTTVGSVDTRIRRQRYVVHLVTHIIACGETDRIAFRTINYLRGIVLGKWIVSETCKNQAVNVNISITMALLQGSTSASNRNNGLTRRTAKCSAHSSSPTRMDVKRVASNMNKTCVSFVPRRRTLTLTRLYLSGDVDFRQVSILSPRTISYVQKRGSGRSDQDHRCYATET